MRNHIGPLFFRCHGQNGFSLDSRCVNSILIVPKRVSNTSALVVAKSSHFDLSTNKMECLASVLGFPGSIVKTLQKCNYFGLHVKWKWKETSTLLWCRMNSFVLSNCDNFTSFLSPIKANPDAEIKSLAFILYNLDYCTIMCYWLLEEPPYWLGS